MNPQEYENRQRVITIDGLGDLVTVEHAARLMKVSPGSLDMKLRRRGWAVFKIGETRLLRLRDLPLLKSRAR